jgi:hypothetical protein
MIPDDAHTSHNHGFELPSAPQVVVQRDARPWRAVAGVAVCLGIAGVVTGLIVARRQSVSDEHLTSDALQREELRDGWRALGVAAAQEARANDAEANAAASSVAAPPNVVIVNVPAQSAVPPSNVTNITLPNGPATGSNGNATAVPTQSIPPINYSPVQGYLPTPGGYPAPASNDIQQPQNGYVTSSGGIVPIAPAVGNGSIPGSTTNSALPNNGLVGSTPMPGQPNGPASTSTPSAPVGAVPSAPGTPSLPTGLNAP